MKLIQAIVQPARLEAVKAALAEIGIVRMTVSDVHGYGRQKGQVEIYRGHEYTVNLLRKCKVEVVVKDDAVEPAVEAVVRAARSRERGRIGDGKVLILPVEDVVRIRTGERGPEAV